LIVALLAVPIMTLLARRKIAIATQLGSRAMRADAVESITCGCQAILGGSLLPCPSGCTESETEPAKMAPDSLFGAAEARAAGHGGIGRA
jgi:hypothetical protein